jgi:hypothetical protein
MHLANQSANVPLLWNGAPDLEKGAHQVANVIGPKTNNFPHTPLASVSTVILLRRTFILKPVLHQQCLAQRNLGEIQGDGSARRTDTPSRVTPFAMGTTSTSE